LVQGIGTSPIAAAKDLLGKLFSEDAVACQTAKRGASNWATAAFGLAKHCTESVQWLQRAQAWSIRKEQVHDETLHAQVKLTVGLRQDVSANGIVYAPCVLRKENAALLKQRNAAVENAAAKQVRSLRLSCCGLITCFSVPGGD